MTKLTENLNGLITERGQSAYSAAVTYLHALRYTVSSGTEAGLMMLVAGYASTSALSGKSMPERMAKCREAVDAFCTLVENGELILLAPINPEE
jgi:hypothetical protein